MNIIHRPSWTIAERYVTPEHIALNRRRFLASAVALGGVAVSASLASPALAAKPGDPYTPKPKTNPSFASAGRPITDEAVNTTYNNFYEFGSHKNIWRSSEALETDGWTLSIEGEVEQPMSLSIDDLLGKVSVEERIYRHRCVEAWAMVVPWIGFPLKDLVRIANPLSSARYVKFSTFFDPEIAAGQQNRWKPWPYVEGVTMEEATNDLAFLVTGAYGKVLHAPFGAPIRLHLPWKYGFKSIKSIAKVEFTSVRPVSFWETLNRGEYGFWANVNPEVSHPRWSQATEKMLGTEERVPTLLYNGYGEHVAHLYAGLEDKYKSRLWR